jgi:enterochelin esterase-like enzyme
MRLSLLFVWLAGAVLAQEPEFPLTEDSKVQDGVAKGTMVKSQYVAKEGSVFPGTVRECQLYLPAGFDKAKPVAFMVFQDGVIYQAPVVFDNLIAKGDMPPMVGVFIKPGVVPAANENALPRFNRSFEYDSVTPLYSRFLIEEFLPAVEREHGITFSTNPNEAAIAGNSSGGICAFMVAWHRPDRFRRVFTGVGTYVGIHGADQLPVWVRKFEPKPIRVFLQSGTGDNNLYCGDWWMANQMMERSLNWAGYEVKHAWGDGGHNQKHASQIFPEAMRWLWREWKTEMVVKANVKGESKWKGYEVVGEGEWEVAWKEKKILDFPMGYTSMVTSDSSGVVWMWTIGSEKILRLEPEGGIQAIDLGERHVWSMGAHPKGMMAATTIPATFERPNVETPQKHEMVLLNEEGVVEAQEKPDGPKDLVFASSGRGFGCDHTYLIELDINGIGKRKNPRHLSSRGYDFVSSLALSPDGTDLYASQFLSRSVWTYPISEEGVLGEGAELYKLVNAEKEEGNFHGMCVDSNGWLYVATSLGIQVLDQAGRVNFIIPTPRPASDVCFGGKDLGELFIACGRLVYKRSTKAKGVVSGQMAPIKPAPPKL